MKTNATFYHAGCPVCVSAESVVTRYLDPTKINLEVVHLGAAKNRVAEAAAAGVKSVPALVIDGQPVHLNFGAPPVCTQLRPGKDVGEPDPGARPRCGFAGVGGRGRTYEESECGGYETQFRENPREDGANRFRAMAKIGNPRSLSTCPASGLSALF